jgi:hypothetical protein
VVDAGRAGANREARTLRVATGLSKAIRMVGTISLGPTAFEIGYLIGSGANAKFLRVGLPAKAPDLSAAPQRLSFYSTCSESSPCEIGSPYHDRATITEPAYVWQWDANWQSPYGANYWTWRSNDSNCQHPPPPPDAVRTFESTTSSSTCWGDPDLTSTTTSAWWYQNDLPAAGPVEDYTGQPSTYQDWWPPTDPGYSTTETRTRTQLESGDYPALTQKLEYELGVPEVCDPVDPNVCNQPTTLREQERKCEVSDPTGQDPDPSTPTDQFAAAQYATVTPFTRTDTNGQSVTTALKVGWTGPSIITEWKGWGWRHVAAKHGWGPADIAATQAALLDTPTLSNGRFQYTGPDYSQNGVICQRRVVVAAGPLPDETSSKEIITSYGEYLRPTP